MAQEIMSRERSRGESGDRSGDWPPSESHYRPRERSRGQSDGRSRGQSGDWSPSESHYRPRGQSRDQPLQQSHSAQQTNNSVQEVINTLGKGNYKGFIDYYLRDSPNLELSAYDKLVENNKHFANFYETCRQLLLTTNSKYVRSVTEGKSTFCKKLKKGDFGPTPEYIGLLKHIVENAETYNKEDAAKIERLLLTFFEENSISYIMFIPYDETIFQIFARNELTYESDGRVNYCTEKLALHRNGMEISNTRVMALLIKIHSDETLPPDRRDGGGNRRTKTNKRKYHFTRRRTRSHRRR